MPCFFRVCSKVFDMKTKRPPRRSSQKKPTPSSFKTKPPVNSTLQALANCPLAWRPSQCHGPLALPGAVLFGTRRCGTTPTLPAPVSRAWLAICLWQMSWGILFGGEKGLGEISSWTSFCYIDHRCFFFAVICSADRCWCFFLAFVVVHEIIRRDSDESRFFMLVVWCFEMLGKTFGPWDHGGDSFPPLLDPQEECNEICVRPKPPDQPPRFGQICELLI